MRPNFPAFNGVETRREILKYKSSIITDTGNRDLGTYVGRVILDGLCYRPSRPAKINSIIAEIWNTLKQKRNAKPTLNGAVDGGRGIIGSHVAKLILYTSLSLMCISNRNQKCLQQKTIFHNGFSDYFLLCSKRVVFIHEQRSDGRARNLWNPLPSTLDKKIDPVSCTYQPPHGAFVAIRSRN